MDALSDVLRVVGLTGGVFLDARFTAPWAIQTALAPEFCKPFMTPPERLMCFHYVVRGECFLTIPDKDSCALAGGDMVLLPHNDVHKLASDVGLPPVPAGAVLMPPDGIGMQRIDHGGGGAECLMVCGFLGGDAQLEPLIATLPPLMKMTVRDTPGAEWISQSFRYGARQAADGDPGAATIMSKICELLFVEAVRRHLVTMPQDHTGFLAGMRDPAIGKALSLLHTQVARDWTAEDLAGAVNMSRSAFAEKFVALVGQPPIKYLTGWRMQLAAHKLREGKLSIAQIAFDTGYESEAAFTRAFKREIGVPPATWRRQLGAGASASASG